jgi:hypothetical protein
MLLSRSDTLLTRRLGFVDVILAAGLWLPLAFLRLPFALDVFLITVALAARRKFLPVADDFRRPAPPLPFVARLLGFVMMIGGGFVVFLSALFVLGSVQADHAPRSASEFALFALVLTLAAAGGSLALLGLRRVT